MSAILSAANPLSGWAQALAEPRFEIMPVRGGLEAARALPDNATVSSTCSPAIGLDKSLDFAVDVTRARPDLRVVAHLAARRVRDRAHLEAILRRLDKAGIRDAFVVAGDQTDSAGAYPGGLALIEAIDALDANLASIGVPCYPEGHPFIDGAELSEALEAKSYYADYMVSQLCFDAATMEGWLRSTRRRGVPLPLYLGIPGVIARRKLLGIGLRIGIGESLHFLRNNTGLVSGLLAPARYTPGPLLSALEPLLSEPELGIAGVHINTFNQVRDTVQWCQSLHREHAPLSFASHV